jgi:hypothetical protein
VPAKLAARARLLGSSSARKTDVADAISVAAVALHNRRLNRVQVEDHNMNRPGESGDFSPWKGWSHVGENVDEVPGRAA